MTRVVRRAGAAAQLERLLRRVTLSAATSAAEVLAEKLSGPGGGVQYPGQPNRSSAPGEYPAEQSGKLRDSIKAKPLEGTRSGFGSVDGPEYVIPLHFSPDGRPFMDDAKHDRDVHRAVREGVKRAKTRR